MQEKYWKAAYRARELAKQANLLPELRMLAVQLPFVVAVLEEAFGSRDFSEVSDLELVEQFVTSMAHKCLNPGSMLVKGW